MLLASTVWVYGATVGDGERTEEAPVDLTQPGHVYVATKLAAELLVHSYREMYGQHFTILRYGIPYGPRMRDALVVARFVRAALAGKPITIAGHRGAAAELRLRGDIADAHVRALAPAAADQVLALEGGTPVSVREIADTVRSDPAGADRAHARPDRRLPRGGVPTGGPRRCLTGRRRPRSRWRPRVSRLADHGEPGERRGRGGHRGRGEHRERL